MNINHINRVGATNPYQKNQEIKGNSKLDSVGNRKDEVSISSQAKKLAAAGGVVRSDKVEQIKESVQQGTYHVETTQLADKMLKYLQPGDFYDKS